jgi:hypothetical protein
MVRRPVFKPAITVTLLGSHLRLRQERGLRPAWFALLHLNLRNLQSLTLRLRADLSVHNECMAETCCSSTHYMGQFPDSQTIERPPCSGDAPSQMAASKSFENFRLMAESPARDSVRTPAAWQPMRQLSQQTQVYHDPSRSPRFR